MKRSDIVVRTGSDRRRGTYRATGTVFVRDPFVDRSTTKSISCSHKHRTPAAAERCARRKGEWIASRALKFAGEEVLCSS